MQVHKPTKRYFSASCLFSVAERYIEIKATFCQSRQFLQAVEISACPRWLFVKVFCLSLVPGKNNPVVRYITLAPYQFNDHQEFFFDIIPSTRTNLLISRRMPSILNKFWEKCESYWGLENNLFLISWNILNKIFDSNYNT